MANSVTERFIDALENAEQTKSTDDLVKIFTENCVLDSIANHNPSEGSEGAEKFWKAYLSTFQSIESEFSNVVEAEKTAVLEWTSKGKLADGHPITYRGVSILEIEGEKVAKFRTYYDSAAFVAAESRAAKN